MRVHLARRKDKQGRQEIDIVHRKLVRHARSDHGKKVRWGRLDGHQFLQKCFPDNCFLTPLGFMAVGFLFIAHVV